MENQPPAHELPVDRPDERSLEEWSAIAAAVGVGGSVDVFVTEEGARFYQYGERLYWLSRDETVVETLEHGDCLAWRTLDRTGRELDGGVCSASLLASGAAGAEPQPPLPREPLAGSSR